jgi:DNA-binding transcriptional MerR regulator
LYLSLVSCEVSIKALLEEAGYSLKEIKKMSHKFSELNKALAGCDFKGDKKGSAASLFAKSPDRKIPKMTVVKRRIERDRTLQKELRIIEKKAKKSQGRT